METSHQKNASMKHPHYELAAVSGDSVLQSFDSQPGFENGKPVSPSRLARQLARYQSEPVSFHPDITANERPSADGKSAKAGSAAADIVLGRVGVEKMVDLLQARPHLRDAMEAHIEAELDVAVSAPEPVAAAPSASVRRRPAPPRPS
jgi:hypothetical protein